jgi:G:T/U-mismatch repair DNA glycosylase
METRGNSFPKKNAVFFCKSCDFKCCKKSDWDRHTNTKKHEYRHNGNILETPGNNLAPKNAEILCDCGKSYNSHSGLWKHKKTCHNLNQNSGKQIIQNNEKIELHDLVDLVKILVKENSNLKTIMVEQQNTMIDKVIDSQNKFFEQSNNVTLEIVKNGINNTTNNTNNNNSHNKAFNLNFFLNETCKNAMNINDFVDSIKLQLSDLESVGKLGYVEGISNIIVKNLNALDETERPIHCTDKKRETVYIKDKDKWEKDDDENKNLRKVIGKVAFNNQKLFPQFKEKYPDYNDSKSKYSDQYSKIVIESFEDSNKEKQDKIIKKITKEVLIEK